MEFVETIREDELVNGTSKAISVKGKDITLFKIDNRITELGNSCLHMGRPLAHGMDGNIISRMERHSWIS
jgi:nitrite reductase/ring-hydroxylating ferredoxin subunit